jgi:hypothetical protein
METAGVVAVINGVVQRFMRAGVPLGVHAADLQQECYMAAADMDSPALIATAAKNCILDRIKAERTRSKNIAEFAEESLAEQRNKIYRPQRTCTDPWQLCTHAELGERNARWLGKRRRREDISARVQSVRRRLADIPVGQGYGRAPR